MRIGANDYVQLVLGVPLLGRVRLQPQFADSVACVAGPDMQHLPARLDAAAFSGLLHLDASPSGSGMLRTIIDRTLGVQEGRRELRTISSSCMAVPVGARPSLR
jgi:hypothetical protein